MIAAANLVAMDALPKTDALVIAYVGGPSLWESTRDEYLKNSISPYLKDRATALIIERIGDSSSSAKCGCVEAQVFTELMRPERYDRVRDYRVGVTLTQLSAVRRYTQDCRQSNSTVEVHRLETQVQEMRHSHEAQLREIRQSYDIKIEQLSQSHQTEIMALKTQIDQITFFLRGFVPQQAPNFSNNCRDDDDARHA